LGKNIKKRREKGENAKEKGRKRTDECQIDVRVDAEWGKAKRGRRKISSSKG
jgi:hypothetical protein